jgi:DMSO/TMAO reductase YedYZ molybdopterin-dependent catalytic subunit
LRVIKAFPFNAETPLEHLGEDITRIPEFFVRNHFAMPRLETNKHRVFVHGAVERRLELSVDDLRAMGTRSLTVTLECAGNGRAGLVPLPQGEPWALGAVSTARWTGVPLRSVLKCARVRVDAVEILAVGVDRGPPPAGTGEIPFARSLPLPKAMDPNTLLAFEMDDEPLPREHGAPVRLIVPGWYGVASVKWLERIEALPEPFQGPFQGDRYVYRYDDGAPQDFVTTMRVRSLIVSPRDGQIVHRGRVTIRGKAWSGEGKIVGVEVAVGADETWHPADLLPAPSRHAWRPWEFVWNATERGPHLLRSRATDAKGNGQPDHGRWNRFGYGNNAAHHVAVRVG